MHLSTTILLGLAATALAQQRDFPACVSSCTTSSPVSSQCNGDEQGEALDRCTCASFTGSLLIECIQACPDADQAEYADAVVPELCRDDLFPGVQADASGTGSGTAATTATTATTTSAGAETQSGTTGTATTASTTTTSEASQASEEAADASETGDGDSGAVGREIAGLLVAGGIIAAMIV